jgi:hypothetical protein
MGQGDRGHPDFRDHWLARKRWSSNTTIPSGKKVVGIAAQHDFYSCGEDVEIKSDSNKTDEAPLSSANAMEWNGGGIEIAERLEAMAGLGRYERPVRRTIFQKEALSAKPPVSSSWVSDPLFHEPETCHLPRSDLDRRVTSQMTWNLKRTSRQTKEVTTERPLSVLGSHPPRPVTLRQSRTLPALLTLPVSRTPRAEHSAYLTILSEESAPETAVLVITVRSQATLPSVVEIP